MAKNPAVLFYTSDFITGVIGFTFEEIGQYIYLLCLQHQKGHLDDNFINSTIPNISEKVLSKFSIDNDGLFFNKRMEEEKKKREKYSKSRSANRSRGLKNKSKIQYDICQTYEDDVNNISQTYEQHMENENDNNYINNSKLEDSNRGMGEEKETNIFDFIEINFSRTLNPIEYEVINTWEDNELTRYAIKQAVLNQAYNVKYINAILENYKSKGIKNVSQAQEFDKMFKQRKNIKNTILPSWFDKNVEEEMLSEEESKELERKLKGVKNNSII